MVFLEANERGSASYLVYLRNFLRVFAIIHKRGLVIALNTQSSSIALYQRRALALGGISSVCKTPAKICNQMLDRTPPSVAKSRSLSAKNGQIPQKHYYRFSSPPPILKTYPIK